MSIRQSTLDKLRTIKALAEAAKETEITQLTDDVLFDLGFGEFVRELTRDQQRIRQGTAERWAEKEKYKVTRWTPLQASGALGDIIGLGKESNGNINI